MRTKVDYRQAGKATYDRFKEQFPSLELTFVDYQNIIYSFNYGFRDYLIETGLKAKYPWGIGDFVITKYKLKGSKTLPDGRVILANKIDWQKTKEFGKYVYHVNLHSDGYSLRYKWFKKSARFKLSSIWYFRTARLTARLIKHFSKQEENFHNKFYSW